MRWIWFPILLVLNLAFWSFNLQSLWYQLWIPMYFCAADAAFRAEQQVAIPGWLF